MLSENRLQKILCAHPGVREAAVVRSQDNGLRSFVVASEAFLRDVLDGGTTESTAIRKWQKTYDLSQLTKEASSARIGFNTAGWNSSYTRQPIPEEEMQEWVETTVRDILKLKPRRVYEIGCGTGMLLVRIAPNCDQYVAADFAPAVLARLHEQMQTIGELKGRVLVEERQADNFKGFDDNSVDTVLLSSVIQYFPTISYLTRVLNNAIRIVSPGGHVYVGDIRSLPLLPAFASSVELFQAAKEMSAGNLRDRIRRRLQREPELVVSPAYFLMLERQNPKISRVEVRPLRGDAQNEMTRYRYQAILHVGGPADVQPEIEFIDWTARKWTLDDIRLILREHPDQKLGIKQIRNARSEKDIEMMHLLHAADPTETVEELRCELARHRGDGICPQELFDLEAEDLGFRVFVSWLSCRNEGSYDAAFIPNAAVGENSSGIRWPQPDTSQFVYLGNGAIQSKHRNALRTVLTEYCVQHIPEDAGEVDIEVVDTLPTCDGDVDVRALLAARKETAW